jgi:hypothetical protein
MTYDAGQLNSAMEQKGKQTARKLNNLVYLDMFLYFLLFSHREGGGGTVGYHAGRCRFRRSDHSSFISPRCNNRGGEVAGLRRRGKRAQ